MDSPKDIWHFARPLLAKQYLGEFDLGLISARALFAKRRMGKSTFLERDLIPAAKQAGYMTPYLNLWTALQRDGHRFRRHDLHPYFFAPDFIIPCHRRLARKSPFETSVDAGIDKMVYWRSAATSLASHAGDIANAYRNRAIMTVAAVLLAAMD
jgi:hypothetical protein